MFPELVIESKLPLMVVSTYLFDGFGGNRKLSRCINANYNLTTNSETISTARNRSMIISLIAIEVCQDSLNSANVNETSDMSSKK